MLESDSMPIRISACDYTDAHDTDELVVLTNESSSPLRLLEPNRHYVLGACVKLSNQNRFVHAKAKSQNVQTARIPFDLYCSFRASKLLPLDHLAQILLEFKYSGNWAKAFEFIERHRLKWVSTIQVTSNWNTKTIDEQSNRVHRTDFEWKYIGYTVQHRINGRDFYSKTVKFSWTWAENAYRWRRQSITIKRIEILKEFERPAINLNRCLLLLLFYLPLFCWYYCVEWWDDE